MSDTMQAAVYTGEGNIEVQTIAVPELAADDALVEVSHCGICGTDLHLVLEKYARPGSVLGHEWSGTLAAVGANVEGWELEARVVAGPEPGCGECRACKRGRPSVCLNREPPDLLDFSHGAFTRYKRVAGSRLLRIPDALSTRAAALTEPTAIALHAGALSGATPDDKVLVTGAGPVGLLITAVLSAHGVRNITVSEPSASRRSRAHEVGAGDVVEPQSFGRAPMGRPPADAFTIVFECSGNAKAAEQALDQLDYAGTFVFVGTGHDFPRVNHNRVIVLEQTIIGAYNYDQDGFAPALELLASGRLPLDHLIEANDIGLDEILPTLHKLAAGELPGKVMVRP
jgi:(R,R)-butanediol dehydrogenase/meso-butanediol dehydrogenase/diacetyl reductase